MSRAQGFEYSIRGDGTVVIMHHGQRAGAVRGVRADDFLRDVESDPQGTMARWTGNYKHGNERAAKVHPRNRR